MANFPAIPSPVPNDMRSIQVTLDTLKRAVDELIKQSNAPSHFATLTQLNHEIGTVTDITTTLTAVVNNRVLHGPPGADGDDAPIVPGPPGPAGKSVMGPPGRDGDDGETALSIPGPPGPAAPIIVGPPGYDGEDGQDGSLWGRPNSLWKYAGCNVYISDGVVGIGVANVNSGVCLEATGGFARFTNSSTSSTFKEAFYCSNTYDPGSGTNAGAAARFTFTTAIVGGGGTFRAAGISGVTVDGASGSRKGALAFQTSTGESMTERMRIDEAGLVGIGTASPGVELEVAGRIKPKGYTVATLPAGVVGAVVYVTDALGPTFLAAVVGGGAVKTLVFYDGTNWVCS